MEVTSNPVLEPHHKKTQSVENEAESKQQKKKHSERVLLVNQPYKSKKKEKIKVEKIKEPKRGLGVAKLEILRLEGKLKEMNDHLEQLQAAKGAAVVPTHYHHHHQQQQQHQSQVPYPSFVDPRQQYTNGMIQGRFVPAGNGNFIFQPMNRNGGYPGEHMNIIPNGGGFIPAGHHESNKIIPNGGIFIPASQEPNNIIGNGGFSGHHEPKNIIGNGGEGGIPGGGVNDGSGTVNGGSGTVKGGCTNQIIAEGNPYMFLDQQLRIQHLKLLHSARELCAMQRLHYHMPQHSKFSDKGLPIVNNSEQSKSKDKMAMNDSCDSLDLSLGRSKTNIDEEVEPVDALDGGTRRRRSTSSVLMEYDFFPGESNDNRSSSYAGGELGSSEASTSDDNTHLFDLSLKLSL